MAKTKKPPAEDPPEEPEAGRGMLDRLWHLSPIFPALASYELYFENLRNNVLDKSYLPPGSELWTISDARRGQLWSRFKLKFTWYTGIATPPDVIEPKMRPDLGIEHPVAYKELDFEQKFLWTPETVAGRYVETRKFFSGKKGDGTKHPYATLNARFTDYENIIKVCLVELHNENSDFFVIHHKGVMHSHRENLRKWLGEHLMQLKENEGKK